MMQTREMLTKRPFGRITSNGYGKKTVTRDLNTSIYLDEKPFWEIITQADFLREYYPSGHKINSELYYPNKIKYDEENKKFYEEKVFRASFPLQLIIATQQLVHLCGNDIRHELTSPNVTDDEKALFYEFQKGWLDKNMEVCFYNLARSVKITGDGAVVFFINEGKIGTKNLSYMTGDTLYPHYDSITGEMDSFARKYNDYDTDGNVVIEWVEVWDKTHMYRFCKSKTGLSSLVNWIRDKFGLDGYDMVGEPQPHQFKECPVVYMRNDDGPCWSFSQDNIDKYELAISHLCQNNMAYAFPIMILKGEDVEIQGDIYGAVKAITMGKDDDAGFLARPEASEAFRLQIETLLRMIFMGSFVVMPPEVKSGDLPGVAIKLIYSPSLEKAMIDAKDFDKTVDTMKRLFLYGYGIETGNITKMSSLRIFSWIVPYVHQNAAELINNLVQACGAHILSKETASELTGYDRNNEWDRIVRELKEEEKADMLYQIKTSAANAEQAGQEDNQ